MKRIILHVDMDAFFAQVEQKDNKDLRGKPVIVGGTNERGVVATCSYEARKYGVTSAMPIFIAKKRCPMGIFLPLRMYRYKEVSEQIFEVFKDVTEKVEPLSIDEAFLDITDSNFESGMEAAKYIRSEVFRRLSLTLSIGISYNKFLAKIASEWNKPNGIKIITNDMLPEVLFPLPINKIFGLGKKSVGKLNNMGMYNIEDLYDLPKQFLNEYLGRNGMDTYHRIRGIDNRELEVFRERKSVGKEVTLKRNTLDKEELLKYVLQFSKEISYILKKKKLKGRTITVKYKTKNFKSHTRSKTIIKYISSSEEIYKEASIIVSNESFLEEIRLIGLSVSSFEEDKSEQLTLF